MKQLYVIAFDVCDPRRLRKVATCLEDVGLRVQHSVFECFLSRPDLNRLIRRLCRKIAPEEDKIMVFPLCPKDENRIQVDGGSYERQDQDYFLC